MQMSHAMEHTLVMCHTSFTTPAMHDDGHVRKKSKAREFSSITHRFSHTVTSKQSFNVWKSYSSLQDHHFLLWFCRTGNLARKEHSQSGGRTVTGNAIKMMGHLSYKSAFQLTSWHYCYPPPVVNSCWNFTGITPRLLFRDSHEVRFATPTKAVSRSLFLLWAAFFGLPVCVSTNEQHSLTCS